ncbi:MAG: serine/threonine protein kinase [Deltaproteobacteria bacterium]|nr:serine/threonine protein kinase [Deltaproteobacteria bacterium]
MRRRAPRLPPAGEPEFPMAVGPFVVSEPIAAGGMARIHLAATRGPCPRLLALKRLHPELEGDEQFRSMLLDEGAIHARVRHVNVVTTHGVATLHERLFLVMDYVEGLGLHELVAERAPAALPPRVVVAIVADALRGLHAAHEAVDDEGRSLGIVHRDVSPENVLVGADGVAKIVDFGVAKAEGRLQITRPGQLKGKLSYMSPEQLAGAPLDRRSDVYAAGVVLREVLAGEGPVALSRVVRRALSVDPGDRYPTALAMAEALEAAAPRADRDEVGRCVRALGGPLLAAMERVRLDLDRRLAPPRGPAPLAAAPTPVDLVRMVALGVLCFLVAIAIATR